MVITEKTWLTVEFYATNSDSSKTANVTLEYNYKTKKFDIRTPNQEMVKFKNDDPEMAELILEAVTEAIQFLKTLR